MQLTGKYIKFKPEITLEIFTLVWNKLIEYRFKHKYGHNLNNEFENFKDEHNYLIIEDGGFNTYLKSCIFDNIETTVQEILGYDPFIKDDFVLQPRWYIKLTKENYSTVVDWCKKLDGNYGRIYTTGSYYGVFESGKGDAWADIEDAKKYQIITFDQFKQYVLCSDKNLVPLPGFDN